MNPLNIRTHPKPGFCKTRRCKGRPRNLSTHPNSSQHCGSCAKTLWRMQNPVKAAYQSLKSSAKRRGISFSLTIEEWEAFVLPTRYMDDKGKQRYCLHVDRKEAHLGYEKGNLQILTCGENVAKGNRERYAAQKISEWKVEREYGGFSNHLEHIPTEEEPF